MYSLPVEPEATCVFEVLRASKNMWAVIPSREPRALEGQQIYVVAQECCVWQQVNADLMRVYHSGDASHLDLTSKASWQVIRTALREWDQCESDTEGCIDISNPRLAVPHLALDAPNVPVLLLLYELRDRGFAVDMHGEVTHTPADRNTIPLVQAHNRRLYYQCVLQLEGLFAGGLQALPSKAPVPFYKLLLKGHIVRHGLKAKQYQEQLKALESGQPAALPPAPGEGAALALPAPPAAAEPSEDSDDILEALPPAPGEGEALPLPAPGDTEALPLPAPGPAEPPLPPPSSSASSSPSSTSESGEILEAPADPRTRLPEGSPRFIDGSPLQ